MNQINRLGYTVKGHVLDVSKRVLEKMLKNYDSQLFLHWNPWKKTAQNGTWEVRRKPDIKLLTYCGEFEGQDMYAYEYKYNSFLDHVMDLPILRYDCLDKIKSMDKWSNTNWETEWDDHIKSLKDNEEKKKWDNIRASIREDKKYWKQLQEATLSGYDPLGWSYHKGSK